MEEKVYVCLIFSFAVTRNVYDIYFFNYFFFYKFTKYSHAGHSLLGNGLLHPRSSDER